jgi:DNA topoisomerase-1
MGHVRDLPPKALGVDLAREFAPEYVVLPRARSTLAALRQAAGSAEAVLLATDPDREGEAIAWHLAEALRLPKRRYRRITFHEISRRAIHQALAHPRDLDPHLIDAQQARRVLDRLVGYQLSPLLWRKVQRGTSAGRVQSVAVRLVVDREREIAAFVPVEYWTIDVRLRPLPDSGAGTPGRGDGEPDAFLARLQAVDGKKAAIPTADVAHTLEAQLRVASYWVRETARKPLARHPAPPFTTSTLQQAAGNRLRFPAKKTMAAAQALYEAGLVTYMRTDSVAVSAEAITQARRVIAAEFGPEYVPPAPRRYATRVKNAQEAHEAIRPVDAARTPAALRGRLAPDEWRVYDLIWKRMVASQMEAARYLQDVAWIDGTADLPEPDRTRQFALKAQATTLVFPGWLAVYGEAGAERVSARAQDTPSGSGGRGARRRGRPAHGEPSAPSEPDSPADPADADAPPNDRLPQLTAGQPLELLDVLPAQHFSQPPRRYTEAALVKALEEAGVGRPSTYATVVSTIQDRGYVRLEHRHFAPTDLGFAANDFLVAHFPTIVDLPFTAEMEDSLDEIAGGRVPWTQMLHRFYGPFAETLARARSAQVSPLERKEQPAAADLTPVPSPPRAGSAPRAAGRGERGEPPIPRRRSPAPRGGRLGAPWANGPQGQGTRSAPAAQAVPAGVCPECGKPLVERRSQYGPFLGCSGFPACRYIRREGQREPRPPGATRRTPKPRSRAAGRRRARADHDQGHNRGPGSGPSGGPAAGSSPSP